jgi:hypothetical protein
LPGVGPTIDELPYHRDADWAEYAIVDATETSVSIEFRRIPVDLSAILRKAHDVGMPDLEWWSGLWKTAP